MLLFLHTTSYRKKDKNTKEWERERGSEKDKGKNDQKKKNGKIKQI